VPRGRTRGHATGGQHGRSAPAGTRRAGTTGRTRHGRARRGDDRGTDGHHERSAPPRTPPPRTTGVPPHRARDARAPRAANSTGGHALAPNRARAGKTGGPPRRARPSRARRARFGTGAGIRQLGSTGVGGNAYGGRGRHGCAHARARPTSASAALLATVVSARACDTGKRRKVAPRLIAAPAASGCTPCWAGGPHVLWHRTTLAARRVYTGACIAVRRR